MIATRIATAACALLVWLVSCTAHALEYRGQYQLGGRYLGFVQLHSGETLGALCAFVASKTGKTLSSPTGCVAGVFKYNEAKPATFLTSFDPRSIGTRDEVVLNVDNSVVESWFPPDLSDGVGVARIALPTTTPQTGVTPAPTVQQPAPPPQQRPARQPAPTPSSPQSGARVTELANELDKLRAQLAEATAQTAKAQQELATANQTIGTLRQELEQARMLRQDEKERLRKEAHEAGAATARAESVVTEGRWAFWGPLVLLVAVVLGLLALALFLLWLFRWRHQSRQRDVTSQELEELTTLRDKIAERTRERDAARAEVQRLQRETVSLGISSEDAATLIEVRQEKAVLESDVEYLQQLVDAWEENHEYTIQHSAMQHGEALDAIRQREAESAREADRLRLKSLQEIVLRVEVPEDQFDEPNLPASLRQLPIWLVHGYVAPPTLAEARNSVILFYAPEGMLKNGPDTTIELHSARDVDPSELRAKVLARLAENEAFREVVARTIGRALKPLS